MAETNGPKPGRKSTEFWTVSVIPTIIGIVLMLCGQTEAGAALMGSTNIGYGVSRGLAKWGFRK